MQLNTKPINGKLSAELTLMPKRTGRLSITPAINTVELVFTGERRTIVVNTWQYDTREEAIDRYKQLCLLIE